MDVLVNGLVRSPCRTEGRSESVLRHPADRHKPISESGTNATWILDVHSTRTFRPSRHANHRVKTARMGPFTSSRFFTRTICERTQKALFCLFGRRMACCGMQGREANSLQATPRCSSGDILILDYRPLLSPHRKAYKVRPRVRPLASFPLPRSSSSISCLYPLS